MVLDPKKLEYYERKYERNPLEDITKYISNKWTLHILRDLFLGKSHFNEFKANRPSLDNKALSRCLKTMQDNGLIYKTNESDDLKNTEYFLTKKGSHSIGYSMNCCCLQFQTMKQMNITQNTQKRN